MTKGSEAAFQKMTALEAYADMLKDKGFIESRRFTAAVAAMQGLLANQGIDVYINETGRVENPKIVIQLAVECADDLLAELSKEKD